MSGTRESGSRLLTTDGLWQTLPHPVGTGVCFETNPSPVWPEEEADLGTRVTDTRRADFRRGRIAAQQALIDLGALPEPIGRRADRAPEWPSGVVGSISHADGLGVAIAGWQSDYRGLGLDVEARSRRLSQSAIDHVSLRDEAEWIRAGPVAEGQRALLLFSAKESVFKAVYPVAQVWLNFQDAQLVWAGDRFVVTLLKGCGPGLPAGYTLRGVSHVLGEHLFSLAWL